jgi:predicted ArsR family transcriptional regulator
VYYLHLAHERSVTVPLSNSEEPMTSSEIAETLGCSRQAALNRLEELSEDGEIKPDSGKVG